MEKKNAIWGLTLIIGGILYPIIQAIVLANISPILFPLDFLGVQIIILRIVLMLLFVTVLYLIIRAYQILKAGGKLKETSARMTRVSGKPKSGVLLGVIMGFFASVFIIYGYIISFPRDMIYPFASWAFGIGYWLVIGGLLFLFAWVILRPINEALNPPTGEKIQAKKESKATKEGAEEIAKEEKRKKKGIKTVVEMEAEMRAEEEKRLQEAEKNRPKGELKTKI